MTHLLLILSLVVHPSRTLRVCADPDNLPFSNRAGAGLENRLAELVARDLNARVEYTFWSGRRGFLRNTLAAGRCDVVMGVPAELDRVLATRPYYRSRFAFVTRPSRAVSSLDDPALRQLRIGIHLVGDDATPPALALARRGMTGQIVGFPIAGGRPPVELIHAVERGDVDVAIVWGPIAGWFGKRLRVTPIAEKSDDGLPMAFDIAVGVRKGDRALRDRIDAVLAARRAEIARLLDEYRVPR